MAWSWSWGLSPIAVKTVQSLDINPAANVTRRKTWEGTLRVSQVEGIPEGRNHQPVLESTSLLAIFERPASISHKRTVDGSGT